MNESGLLSGSDEFPPQALPPPGLRYVRPIHPPSGGDRRGSGYLCEALSSALTEALEGVFLRESEDSGELSQCRADPGRCWHLSDPISQLSPPRPSAGAAPELGGIDRFSTAKAGTWKPIRSPWLPIQMDPTQAIRQRLAPPQSSQWSGRLDGLAVEAGWYLTGDLGGHLFGDGRYGSPPNRRLGPELLKEAGTAADLSIWALHHVAEGERAALEELDQLQDHLGPDGLHQVACQRPPAGRVEVEEPEARVEGHAVTRHCRLQLQGCEEDVERCMKGSHCPAGSIATQGR